MNEKHFEKLNIKIVVTMQQYNAIRNFNQFEKLQILEPNLPTHSSSPKKTKNKKQNKNMNDKNFEKINIKFEIRI